MYERGLGATHLRFSIKIAALAWSFHSLAMASPQRIASGSLASDEIVLDLLGRQGELSRLVAVSTLATDARYSNVADKVPASVTGRVGGELESLLKLRPDLAILASYNKPEIRSRLEAAHVEVYSLGNFKNLDDIEHNVTTLGHLVGADQGAAAMLKEFQDERRAAHKAVEKRGTHPTVLDFAPDGSVSAGETLFDALVREAGAVNVAAELGLKNWPKLSTEVLTALRPDFIVVSGKPEDREALLAEMRRGVGWKTMPAVVKGRIIIIPGAELSSVSPFVARALAKLLAGLASP